MFSMWTLIAGLLGAAYYFGLDVQRYLLTFWAMICSLLGLPNSVQSSSIKEFEYVPEGTVEPQKTSQECNACQCSKNSYVEDKDK